MASAWLETLRTARKTCLVQDGRRKIHFTFPDGNEMAEEYDMRTEVLLVRKWRKKGTLGAAGNWEFEVGEHLQPRSVETEGFVESSSNPIFARADKKKSFQWRIRNLPYSVETYDVQIDTENRNIIIRTTNKKYYKKFSVPDLDRANLPLEQDKISVAHANNTLIITYEKPTEILQQEKLVQEELKKTKALKDGDLDGCNPS